MSDTENTLIDSLFEQYYELFPNSDLYNKLSTSEDCEHKNITTTLDEIYYVSKDCGQCVDYTNIQHIEFELIKSSSIKDRIKRRTI
jgi:hypothetical protein